MRVLVLFNPVSGAGRAAAAAHAVHEHLAAAGHEACLAETQAARPGAWLDPQLGDRDLVVVCGGDGAVRLVAASAERTRTPIYHFPCGTENLFAREHGNQDQPRRLAEAIERWNVREADLAEVNGHTCVLMASIGFDAEVVHDLAAGRRSSISHLSYVRPILRQWVRWRPPTLRLEVDGETVIEDAPGIVVIANCRQYGLGLNPVPDADMFDGLLDLVYLPVTGRASLIGWAVRCHRTTHRRHPGVIRKRGKAMRVRSATPVHYQIDGDAPPGDGGTGSDIVVETLEAAVRPAALPVLIP